MSVTNTFDYYNNERINAAIRTNIRHIKNRFDREDCQQDIFMALYDEMPLDEDEAVKLVNRVAFRYKYDDKRRNAKEIGLDEAGL